MKLLIELLNLMHMLILFIPIFIFIFPVKYFKSVFKYIFLFFILIPIQWILFDSCLLTSFTQKHGGLQNTKTTSPFSEVYLKWLYKPILSILNLEWNNDNLYTISVVHALVNILLLWIFLFFIGKDKLI